MNEQERKLREAWAKASYGDRVRVCVWDQDKGEPHELGSAIRAFCESDPSAPAVVEPEALRRVREAWGSISKIQRDQDLAEWRRENAFAMSPWYIAFRKALADLLESAPVAGGEYAAKLAAIKEDRDKLEAAFERIVPLNVREQDGTVEGMERWIRANLTHAFGCPKSADHELRAKLALVEKERDAAQQEARNMQSFAVQNANALNAAQREFSAAKRSYTEQIAELTGALESEKTAHSEALAELARVRPKHDAYEKVCGALGIEHDILGHVRKLQDAAASRPEPERFERAVDREMREAFKDKSVRVLTRANGNVHAGCNDDPRATEALSRWLAAPLTAPKVEPERDHFAGVGKKVAPAHVLEMWASEHPNGYLGLTLRSLADPVKLDPSAIRAHKVALPIIETVERGEVRA